jgi:hypothetical protein
MEQLNDWADFYRREPFGFPAADLLTAHLAHVVAATGGAKDLSPGDFLVGEALRDASAVEGLSEEEAQAVAIERLFEGHMVVLGPDGKPDS